jgi:lipopolysaccharide transport system permease protein
MVIRAGSTRASLNFKQIWLYRDLLFSLSGREIKLRYRQTALGVIWVVLQPLLGAGILSFVFNGIAKMPTDGANPFVFTYAGLLTWNLFNATVTKGSGVLVGNASLISKVYFPRLCLPLATIFPILIDLGVALAMMALLMVINSVSVSLSILLWPIFVLITLTLGMGIGLIASSLMVTYRDIQHIVPVVLNLLLFGSPVAYSSKRVPEWAQGIYNLNPLVHLLEGSRYALVGVGQFKPFWILYSLVFSIVVFFIGLTCFRSMERKFADVI